MTKALQRTMTSARNPQETCRRRPLLQGNTEKLAEVVIFCKKIAENMQRGTTSARKFQETCRRRRPLQGNPGKHAEGTDFCKKIPKNMQKTNFSACKSWIPAKVSRRTLIFPRLPQE